MPLVLLVGINGVGKDTVANEIKTRWPGIKVVSGSKVFMKAAGLSVGLNTNQPASLQDYQFIEAIPADEAEQIYNTQFYQILSDLKNSSAITLLLYHLCIVKVDPKSNAISFDDSFVRDWYYDLFDCFILLHTDATQIQTRQLADATSGRRSRPVLPLTAITEQMKRSNQQWELLTTNLKARHHPHVYQFTNHQNHSTITAQKIGELIQKL